MSRNPPSAPRPPRHPERAPGHIRKALLIAAIWAAIVAGAGAGQAFAAPPATAIGAGAGGLGATPAESALRMAMSHPDENGAEVDERHAYGNGTGGRVGRGEERRRRGKSG
jgi:hypothetical protein